MDRDPVTFEGRVIAGLRKTVKARGKVSTEPNIGLSKPDVIVESLDGHVSIVEIKTTSGGKFPSGKSLHFGAIAQAASFAREYEKEEGRPASAWIVVDSETTPKLKDLAAGMGVKIFKVEEANFDSSVNELSRYVLE